MTSDVRMKGFAKRSSVADAEALIAARITALGSERVPFVRAHGRILAEDIVSDRDIPPHAKSAMDGYAVRAADCPGRLTVVAELMAADVSSAVLGPGQAARIMTGARLVSGADTVVMVESTKLEGDVVIIAASDPTGTHVLRQGEDLSIGQTVLTKGRRIRAQDVAMLVTVGALEVAVARKPRVRIVPTGNELVPPGASAIGSQVVESNSFMLALLAERDGAEVEVHPIVRDDEAALERAIAREGADLVVVTGGSSVGKQDLGPVVVRRAGELPIHGVHARPASPSGVGFAHGKAIVLAPGFPVASYVAWDLFGRTIVQRMLGIEPFLPYPLTSGVLAAPYSKPPERLDIARVTLSNGAISVLPGGAALLSTTTKADGFVLFPPGNGRFSAGSTNAVHLYT